MDGRGEREAAGLGGPIWTTLASGAETQGAFELFEESRPADSGPPRHVHRDHEELFFILEGRYRFARGSDELEAGPGEVVVVPSGTEHAFRTLEPSRTLIVIAPAGLEPFFREMGVRLSAGATALEAMAELSARYDAHPVAIPPEEDRPEG